MRTWTIPEDVGMVQDQGHKAVPWSALRPMSEDHPDAWVGLPGTRWGGRYQGFVDRANHASIAQSFPFVQRVVAVDEGWRFLVCRGADLPRLGDTVDVLEAGGVVDERSAQELMQKVLRDQVEKDEAIEAAYTLPDRLEAMGAPDAAFAVTGQVDADEVVRLYLVIAADTAPLPTVEAEHVEVTAHDVVLARLVQAVAMRPELATRSPMGGAESWQMYERWAGVR